MNLATTFSIYGGGVGSGCNPAAGKCGRPLTQKSYNKMYQKLKSQGIPIKKGTSAWDIVKTYDAWHRAGKIREQTKKATQRTVKRAKANLQKAIKQGKLKKIGKATPGISKSGGKEHIDIKEPWKGVVKKQYDTAEGHKITELKTPKEYEKSGRTWLLKDDKYKGQYLRNTVANQYDDPKVKTAYFDHQASPEAGRSIEVRRNMGELQTRVIERTLGQYNTIIQHREVLFNNMGRASGFLNKRYGITFKFKGGQ